MAVVSSGGQLAQVGSAGRAMLSSSVRLADDYTADYEAIWRTQPGLRTVVGFLARNFAQVGLHAYQRNAADDSRIKLRIGDHPIARTLAKPNPVTTPFRWKRQQLVDLAVYDRFHALKVKGADGGLDVWRLPPERVTPVGTTPLGPSGFEVRRDGGPPLLFPADRILYLRGPHLGSADVGSAPIEALRSTLAEEFEASRYRMQMWRNGARMQGVIERPSSATGWSDASRERFRGDWRGLYTGDGPAAGGVPILEDGMTFRPMAFDAKQSQYVEARKLGKEEVASFYWVAPPLVGILDHATFSNIKEQHAHLYADTLGPWFVEIEEDYELQLLSEFSDAGDVYLEHNIAEKLRGDPIEQASVLQTAVGGPYMTRNEGRALLNLPAIEGGDELIVPLNVITGGQASPTDSAPPKSAPLYVPAQRADTAPSAKAITPARIVLGKAQPEGAQRIRTAAVKAYGAAIADVVDQLGPAALADGVVDVDEWTAAFEAVLGPLHTSTAEQAARKVVAELGAAPADYPLAGAEDYLAVAATSDAARIAEAMAAGFDAAAASDDPDVERAALLVDAGTGTLAGLRAAWLATSLVGFGSYDGASYVENTTADVTVRKTWHVTSGNPRSAHLAVNGETVDLGEVFSNGLRFPGDGRGTAGQTARCECVVSYTAEGGDNA